MVAHLSKWKLRGGRANTTSRAPLPSSAAFIAQRRVRRSGGSSVNTASKHLQNRSPVATLRVVPSWVVATGYPTNVTRLIHPKFPRIKRFASSERDSSASVEGTAHLT